eukprot:m51a1_g3648 putative adenylate guanylate cyclase (363) ;mRNA; r:203836-205472
MLTRNTSWSACNSLEGLRLRHDLQAFFLILPDGTMLSGLMWDATDAETLPSRTLVQQTSENLLLTGETRGLYWIPELEVSALVVSESVRMSDGSGGGVGWMVMARSTSAILPEVAHVADICVALLPDNRFMPSVWKGSPVKMSGNITDEAIVDTVAAASLFDAAHLKCSSNANTTDDTYLAIGMVMSDEVGAGTPRAHVLIRGIRHDSPVVESVTLLIYLLMEYFVLHVLASLSSKIVEVSNHVSGELRLEVTGKSELRKVTHAVNDLLLALEVKTEQTESILRSIYPEEVLGRIKRGESNNLTFPEATVLFVDICNFTLWSSALTPEHVTKYLNCLYSNMDELVHKEGVVKVMTIGDAYVE